MSQDGVCLIKIKLAPLHPNSKLGDRFSSLIKTITNYYITISLVEVFQPIQKIFRRSGTFQHPCLFNSFVTAPFLSIWPKRLQLYYCRHWFILSYLNIQHDLRCCSQEKCIAVWNWNVTAIHRNITLQSQNNNDIAFRTQR